MSETLHFRVGGDTGVLLANIAQEHFLYGNDLNKALGVFNDSFGGGCPEPMQLRLLRGDSVVEVDVEQQMFLVAEREAHHEGIYPAVIDFKAYFDKKQEDADKHAKDLSNSLDFIIREFKNRDTQWFEFSSEAIIKFIYHGDDKDMIDEIHYDYELNSKLTFIRLVKEFIEKSMKLKDLSKQIHGLYPELKIDFDINEVWKLMVKLQALGSLDFRNIADVDEFQEVTNYLDAANKIDEVIEKGIVPVNILDNYSAGWLSPEGDFYGLNGEIANMLHNQIAEALQEKGVIPMYEDARHEELDQTINPDVWLEQQGWVKIHGNNVHFAGCLNNKSDNDKPNVNMTEKQIHIIKEYIRFCHQSIIKAGWRMERVSIGMFTAMALSNPIALNKKYFEF